ncbi:hypothetical protein KJ639_03275 [Patescibacteria group bacterium]|nr:hypothetical protein [Patescibacteria group bacterium]
MPPLLDSTIGELSELNLIWDLEIRQLFAPIPVFLKENFYTLAQVLTGAILAKIS